MVGFARATGDLHALSAVDTRLIALAHTLEVNYYGSAHLRDRPAPPKVQKKRVIDVKVLPGWGAEGGDWAEIDRLNEEEEAAAEAVLSTAGASHIAAEIQQLSLEDAAAAAANFEANGDNEKNAQRAQRGDDSQGESDLDSAEEEEEESDEEEEDENDDEWEVAAKNKNKARRAKRRAYRRAEYTAAAMETLQVENEDQEEESSDNDDDSEDESSVPGSNAATDEAGPSHPEGESLVCCITGDFAMQNVLLQMGLRLAAPDGHRITSVSRWVLRCTACFQVTKEVGRLFCPRCGNAALDKVKVTVGPDGSEQYGVKKKHILRGTKFSLPKPRGGRNRDPILREDQLLTKKHLLRAHKAAEKAALEQTDPFAPEYTADTWHQAAALPGGMQGAAALLAGWKKNPNERIHRATNRRRK